LKDALFMVTTGFNGKVVIVTGANHGIGAAVANAFAREGARILITYLRQPPEGYFNGVDGTPIQDRFAEGVIINAIEWGRKAVADGSDLEARTQVQWASVVALNGWVQVGTDFAPPVHIIEHTLSAHHNITHGAGLAVVNPAWMRFAAKARPDRFAQFAERVFGLPATDTDDLSLALEGISKLEDFLRSIGCPMHLSELGISDELFSRYAQDAVLVVHDENGNLPGRPLMSKEDIVEVLRSAL
jgi:alcohol dehydrogenase YqhD (iron-dependent ADH family)